MPSLPQEIMVIFAPFMQIFSRRVWDWVQVLAIGAILAPGKRTVSSVLHVMGLKDKKQFQNYHRVLNRARWSALAVSKVNGQRHKTSIDWLMQMVTVVRHWLPGRLLVLVVDTSDSPATIETKYQYSALRIPHSNV